MMCDATVTEAIYVDHVRDPSLMYACPTCHLLHDSIIGILDETLIPEGYPESSTQPTTNKGPDDDRALVLELSPTIDYVPPATKGTATSPTGSVDKLVESPTGGSEATECPAAPPAGSGNIPIPSGVPDTAPLSALIRGRPGGTDSWPWPRKYTSKATGPRMGKHTGKATGPWKGNTSRGPTP